MDNKLNDINTINTQILEFLYYESISLTISYAENYLLSIQDKNSDNVTEDKKYKDKKKIDDINIVIKSYLDTQKIVFTEDLLKKGKLCSLVSLVFNLSSHREVSEKLIYLFLEVSQTHIKRISQDVFWFDLYLLLQIQMTIELNGIVKRPVSMITKAVFNEYQNHEIFSLITIQKLKYYSCKKNEIIKELENSTMEEIVNKYPHTQFVEKMVIFFKYLLKNFPTPILLYNKPSYLLL